VNYANNVYRNRGGVASQTYRPGGIATRTMNYNRPTTNEARPGGNVNPGPNSARPGTTNNNYNRPTTNGSPAGRPASGYNNPSNGSARPSLYSDRQGNVYQRQQSNSDWQQRQNRSWNPVNNSRPEVQNLNAQQMNRNRGEQRAQNFQRIPSSPSSGGYHPSGGGGGGRPSSGGGGGGRSGGGGGRGR
jgi:translation initiation factor IF-2